MKACRTCRRERPLEMFYQRKGVPFAECKDCSTARNRAWHQANPSARRAKNAENWSALRREKPVYALWKSARDRARAGGQVFDLTLADIVIPATCPVLGIPLQPGLGHGQGMALEARDRRPSIDRRDNTKGYTADNIVVVSYRANRLKSDATPAEIRALAAFYGGDDDPDR